MNITLQQWLKVTGFILIVIAAVFGAAQFPAHTTEAQGDIPLSYGTSAFGVVAAEAPTVTYTFSGTAGDLVEIDVQSVSGTLNPSADLVGPDQLLLANGQYNRLTMRSHDAHIAAFLTQNGAHTITVSGLNGSVGDYVLRLNGRAWMSPLRLQYDVALDVNIAENTPPQYFDFETGDCPTTLIVTNLFGGEPYTFPFVVRVRDERGQEVALLRGGDAQEDHVTVPGLSGRYEVEVFADDPTAMGLISLLITCAENAPGCDQSGGGTTTASDSDCPCPTCPGTFSGGTDGSTCPDMDPRAVVVDPEVRGTLLTWNPVPGAEAYGIYMYGLREDGEHYLGMAGAPGDATEFMFDHLFPGFYGFRFVVEALVGEAPICSGETTVTFTDTTQVCPDMNLQGIVLDNEARIAQWTWNPFPGAEGYFNQLFALMPDGSAVPFGVATLESETTVWDTIHPPGLAATNTFGLLLQVIMGDSLICPAGATVTFEPEGPIGECENFAISVAVSPEDFVEVHWPLVPGAVGYAVNVTTSDGTPVPGFPAGAGPDQDWYNFGGLAPGSYMVTVVAHAADGSIMCQSAQPFEIGGASECGNFTMSAVANADGTITAEWPPYPGATGYHIRLLTETGDPMPDGYPLTLLDTSYSSYTFVSPGPGNYLVSLSVINAAGADICPLQVPVTVGGDQTPCEVIAEREGVQVHVGPGRHRSIFTYMDVGRAYLVTGYNYDPDGFPWWQLDKTQFPGHEAVISLWVAESDVTEYGNCTDIPQVDIPDIVPGGDDGGGDGGWGACGSCDSCGHPASECVTDPSGACVWDPGTCGGGDPDDFGDDDAGGCYTVGVLIDPPGFGNSASVQTASNCTTEGGGLPGFTSGTVITVSAIPDPKWNFFNWTGCGTGGSSSNPVSFTITHDCQITAHFVQK